MRAADGVQIVLIFFLKSCRKITMEKKQTKKHVAWECREEHADQTFLAFEKLLPGLKVLWMETRLMKRPALYREFLVAMQVYSSILGGGGKTFSHYDRRLF